MKNLLCTLVCSVLLVTSVSAQFQKGSISKTGNFSSDIVVNGLGTNVSLLQYEQAHLLGEHWLLGAEAGVGLISGYPVFQFNPYLRYYLGKRDGRKTHFFLGTQVENQFWIDDQIYYRTQLGLQAGLNHFIKDNLAFELTTKYFNGENINPYFKTELRMRSFTHKSRTKQPLEGWKKGDMLIGERLLNFQFEPNRTNTVNSQLQLNADIQYFLTDRWTIGTDSYLNYQRPRELGHTIVYGVNLISRYYLSNKAWPIYLEGKFGTEGFTRKTRTGQLHTQRWLAGTAMGITKNLGTNLALDFNLGVEHDFDINRTYLKSKLGLKFNIGN